MKNIIFVISTLQETDSFFSFASGLKDKNKNIFVMCHTGTRSQIVVKWLKKNGYEYCVNVLGGIDAWAALIDRNIRRY